MTSCEQLGYKVGDLFEVTEAYYGFTLGQIIELYYDDESDGPLFKGECRYNACDGEGGAYLDLDHVKPYVKPEDNQESFSCTFNNYGKDVTVEVSQEDALTTTQIIECFLEAYNKSGYQNKLSIVLQGGYGGDRLLTSNVDPEDDYEEDPEETNDEQKLDSEVERKLEYIQGQIEAMQEELAFVKAKYNINS